MTEKELEIYFRQMKELFRMEGWQTLLKDLKEQVPLIDSLENTKDTNDLYFRKGQLNILGVILNLETTTDQGLEESQRDYNV
tara:strand:- start:188 stop:433 length:246 start_codon:yes stop_codon:yes gene_type:complete